MRRIIGLLILVLAMVPGVVNGQTGVLPRSAPEAQGVSPRAVAAFIDSLMALSDTHVQHVMVLRHGAVVGEVHASPFRAEDVHTLYSESKTWTCMAVGIAIDDGKLRLDDPVVKFFADKLPADASDELKAMTVRDLLTMQSGITPDWVMRNWSTDWARTWLSKPVSEPGKKFQYDSMCTYMLSAIVQRATGHTVLELLKERLLGPMGIAVADWEQSPTGENTGGWGLRVQAESQAKLGLLLLAGGKWQGKQLVSKQWIEEATKQQVDFGKPDQQPTDGNQGYGYQLWRSQWPGSFRADGAYGQFVVCVPSADLVVVINGLSYRTSEELNCIWNQLMPGVKDGKLAADASGTAALQAAVKRAQLPLLGGKRTGRVAAVEGTLAPNDAGLSQVKVLDQGGKLRLVVRYADYEATDTLALAYGGWARTTMNGRPSYSVDAQCRMKGLTVPMEVAGNYAWERPEVLKVQLYYVNMISRRVLTLDFKQRTVSVWDSYSKDKTTVVGWK